MSAPSSSRDVSALEHIDRVIEWFEAAIIAAAMLLMAANTLANVLGRYVFSKSLYFSEELNEILIVTITFMGLGYVTRKGRHIRMSALYDMIPTPMRRWVMALIALTTAIVMFLLAFYAWEYVAKVAARGRVTPAMQLPLWTTYVTVVIGLVLAGIQFLFTVWANLSRSEGVWVSHCETDEYEDPELSELLAQHELDKSQHSAQTREN